MSAIEAGKHFRAALFQEILVKHSTSEHSWSNHVEICCQNYRRHGEDKFVTARHDEDRCWLFSDEKLCANIKATKCHRKLKVICVLLRAKTEHDASELRERAKHLLVSSKSQSTFSHVAAARWSSPSPKQVLQGSFDIIALSPMKNEKRKSCAWSQKLSMVPVAQLSSSTAVPSSGKCYYVVTGRDNCEMCKDRKIINDNLPYTWAWNSPQLPFDCFVPLRKWNHKIASTRGEIRLKIDDKVTRLIARELWLGTNLRVSF